MVVDQVINGAPVVQPCKPFMPAVLAGWNGYLDHQKVKDLAALAIGPTL
jgi:hypothetical protein